MENLLLLIGWHSAVDGATAAAGGLAHHQTRVEVAVAAADGDLNVAVEILMTQQV
ncbi:RHOMBOID-like protein 15 [Actinidia rufa]|uniref:RHOMBOID-like protein 15 n=1 Tax=Actinidia rufa TaxID=165716 RepID=A0A7J0F487_9ERIC|nr:RHOMBOID-like protein 15 [Actinidia rufa]